MLWPHARRPSIRTRRWLINRDAAHTPRVYRLLEGHQKPADTAHLYLIAGTLCGLLANASTDLGYHDAAAEQARAAWAYAEITGHNGLRAWTRGMQALIEYWSERPRQAARLAQGAQRHADSTTAKIQDPPTSQEAHDLDERIEEFCTTTAARDLPPNNSTR